MGESGGNEPSFLKDVFSWEAYTTMDTSYSACFLSRLRFIRSDQPGHAYQMGCRQKCKGAFGCVCNAPESIVSFASERSHCCEFEWHGSDVKVAPISHAEALRFYATKWDLPEGVPTDFWELLDRPLTEYDGICQHVRNMLMPSTTFDSLLASRKQSKVYDPQTKSYSLEDTNTKKVVVARMATRETPAGTCANSQCTQGRGGARYIEPNSNKKKVNKARALVKKTGLCNPCNTEKNRSIKSEHPAAVTSTAAAATPAPKTDKRKAGTPPVYAANCAPCGGGAVISPVVDKTPHDSSKRIKTARGLDGVDSAAAIFYKKQMKNIQKKLRRRDASVSHLDGELQDAELLRRELERSICDDLQIREGEQRVIDTVEKQLYGADNILEIWLAFGKDRQQVEHLNADMELKGQGYSVPADLMPIFDAILQCVFSVTSEAIAEYSTSPKDSIISPQIIARAKVVLASAGYQHFSSIIGRPKLADGGAPPILNGLQSRMAMLMKEGNLNAVLKEANSAGLAIAQRTANERLDREALLWEDSLDVDHGLSQELWTDNEEHLIWSPFFAAKSGSYEHVPVNAAWTDGLPPAWEDLDSTQCFCYKSGCKDNVCPCAKRGLSCAERRCGCVCTLFPGIFSALNPNNARRGNRTSDFAARATRSLLNPPTGEAISAAAKADFNPNAKSQDRAEAKDSSSLATHSFIASATSNIDDRHISYTRRDVLPRKTHGEVSASDLTLEGFRDNLLPQAKQAHVWWWEWGNAASTVYSPDTVEYKQWTEQVAEQLTDRQRSLRQVHSHVHGESEEIALLDKTVTDPTVLKHWRETYEKFSRNDTASADIGAVSLIRRIIAENTARRDPVEIQRRGLRDGVVMAAVAKHWDISWGAMPTQCDEHVPSEWLGWLRLYTHVNGLQNEQRRAPKSLRKVLEFIAECEDDSPPKLAPEPSPKPDEDGDGDDDNVDDMTYRMMPLYMGSASDHRHVEKHLTETLDTLKHKDEPLANGTGQYLPYSKQSDAQAYDRPLVQDVPQQKESLQVGSVFSKVWSGAEGTGTRAWDDDVTPVPAAELTRYLVVVTDFAIQQHYEDKMAHHGKFQNVLLVPALLHYTFAGLDAVVRRHFKLLSVVPDLREALNITSDAQERYVTEPTADVRKMIHHLDQYATAIAMRARHTFSKPERPLESVKDLYAVIAERQAKLDNKGQGKTWRIIQELEFVNDYLPVRELFMGAHDGDWRRTMAGFVQLGPLLIETERPKKGEEWLSHMIRFSRMSKREYTIVTHRCLFHRYYNGTKVCSTVSKYTRFGESLGEHRNIMNDENGEDFVGRMKVSGSFSPSELHRRSKLFNTYQKMHAHTRRKRHRSSAICMVEDGNYLTCVFNIFAELQGRPHNREVENVSHRDRAVAMMMLALQRRKRCTRKPIEHVQTRRTEVSYRQIIANLRVEKTMAALAGSAADYIAKGFPQGGLRRASKGVPGKGSEVKWPTGFVQDLHAAIVRCEISYDVRKADFANFGPILAPAVMKYVRQARSLWYSKRLIPQEFGIRFLHCTPLGEGEDNALTYTEPVLDAWAGGAAQQPAAV